MLSLSSQPLSRQSRLGRGAILTLSVAPILGASLYNQGFRLPFLVCPLRHWTGIPCPTCGMTRSFMAIARGDFSQAVSHHLLGPAVFLIFLLAVLHLGTELWTQRRIERAFYLNWIRQRSVQFVGLSALLAYHAARLHALSASGELSVAIAQSPLGHFLLSGVQNL